MCGIFGFWSDRQSTSQARETAERMATSLNHRGPDSHGIWQDSTFPLTFGHARLAILDLSAAGHQPYHSACGRFVVTYNGEIYNFHELARQLEAETGHHFEEGYGDTAVLVHGIATWGVQQTIEKCNGMFAIAVWDSVEQSLTLLRDRIGEKPLYYTIQNGTFAFASELKAICCHPEISPGVSSESLATYTRFGYVPAPHTIYEDVFKLQPGTLLTIPRELLEAHATPGTLQQKLTPVSYWTPEFMSRSTQRADLTNDPAAALNELDDHVQQSVKLRMVADVPIGAFLSGGYDSSLIAAVMQSQSSQPINTFSIGFEASAYNEAPHAKAIAEHLGTCHREHYVTDQEALSVIPTLSHMYDEPFGDSSQIPTWCVSRLAREHVTVALSGDGGDELFGGYERYPRTISGWNRIGKIPAGLRKLYASTIARLLNVTVSSHGATSQLSDRLRKVAHELASQPDANRFEDFYQRRVSQSFDPTSAVVGQTERKTIYTTDGFCPEYQTPFERMMYLDLCSYLPDDILVKVDRATMAVSLESRIPLLDPNVIEFAWSLPMSLKVRDGEAKWLLRRLAERHIPHSLLDRPKQGFGLPVAEWLRGPLRTWAEDLLSESALNSHGLLKSAPIRETWQQHLSGRRNCASHLWSILMFQQWHFDTNTTALSKAA